MRDLNPEKSDCIYICPLIILDNCLTHNSALELLASFLNHIWFTTGLRWHSEVRHEKCSKCECNVTLIVNRLFWALCMALRAS